MKAKLKNQQKGFTIIEVLIVLAIAGLIILIVFLAVPALQRNSRNTQRKNDVSRASALVGEWVANNNGRVPANTGPAAADTVDLGTNYTQLDPPPNGAAATTATFPGAADVDTFILVVGFQCENNALTASRRAYAITYNVETSGAPQQQCV